MITHFRPSASLVGKQGSGQQHTIPCSWASAKVKSLKMALGYHFLFVARESRGSAYTSLPVPWLRSCCEQTRRSALEQERVAARLASRAVSHLSQGSLVCRVVHDPSQTNGNEAVASSHSGQLHRLLAQPVKTFCS